MLDQIYYHLDDAERILACSRDTLYRYERVGLLILQGEHRSRRVTGASLRALSARIEQGEDICATLKALESGAPSEAKPTAKVRSIKTKPAVGGISPQPRMDSGSLADAPLVSKRPAWLKEIT